MKNNKEIYLSEHLAEFVTNSSFEDIPKVVIDKAKRSIVDTIGVAIGALAEKNSDVFLNYIRELSSNNGHCSILGINQKFSSTDASFINGVLAHLLDFDDSHTKMGGHPSASVVPTCLAMAEELKSTGEEFLHAYILGVEITTKLSYVVNPIIYSKGWHVTSVLSAFGATIAAAKLLNLDKEKTKNAISTAASFSSGLKGNFGTLTKSVQVGKAAQNGVQAAWLAKFGNTAKVDIFEKSMGFLEVYCSPSSDDWNLEELFEGLGNSWELVNPGFNIKPYPCCGSTHSTIDAHLALIKEEDVQYDDILEIRNYIHEERIPHTNRSRVQSGLEGKFSNQYCTALCWIKGKISLEDFQDSMLEDQQLNNLMKKIKLYPDQSISQSTEKATHAYVEVVLKDGRVLKKYISNRNGTPQNPLKDEEIFDKFYLCVQRTYSKTYAEGLLSNLMSVEKFTDINNAINING